LARVKPGQLSRTVDGEIRLHVPARRTGGTPPWSAGPTIGPDGAQPELLGRLVVVKQTLGDVQDPVTLDSQPLEQVKRVLEIRTSGAVECERVEVVQVDDRVHDELWYRQRDQNVSSSHP
jgi:hypothetical protein